MKNDKKLALKTLGGETQNWIERHLVLGTGLYVVCTLLAQWIAVTPSWRESSPIEISSDLIASIGMAFAAVHARSRWSNRLVRARWLIGGAGMMLIWCGETAVDKIAPDFRIVIALWALAAVLLHHTVSAYSTRKDVMSALRAGIAAQVIAHIAWFVQEGVLHARASDYPGLEIVTDTGELCALACYILALHFARRSGLDDRSADAGRLHRWQAPAEHGGQAAPSRPRVCFVYIAQDHQVLHSLPIAVSLANRHPSIDVFVAGTSHRLHFIRQLLRDKAPGARLQLDELRLPAIIRLFSFNGAVAGKKRTLLANRLYLSGFDAIVVPERTSTYLRRICPPWMHLVGTEHGAGDREVTFVPELAHFDFLMLPGRKQARRLVELGYTREGHFASGIYAKFDWTRSNVAPRIFDNGRPTVLYCPHFSADLSSWHVMGWQVLDYFANSARYNLIFAPHMRLFDAPTAAKYRRFRPYMKLPNIHVDLGSSRCVDMTYTAQADIFVGDVSSQVVEFLSVPRPCVFLNPRQLPWQDDLHFRFWNLGPVVNAIEDLDAALLQAVQSHPRLVKAQRDYIDDSLLGVVPGESGSRGADALASYLTEAPFKR